MARLDTEELIAVVIAQSERAHPRSCSNCGRSFASLRDYFLGTTTIGTPLCYDEPDDDPSIGTLAYVNCACRSTLATRYDRDSMPQYQDLLAWLARESAATGAEPGVVLERLRVTIRERVVGQSATNAPGQPDRPID